MPGRGSGSAVRNVFRMAKQRNGAPRLTEELRAQGLGYNVKTVAASPHCQGLRAKAYVGSAQSVPVLENLLKQNFHVSGLNHKWSGYITYLFTDEGCLYLTVIIDLWSRAAIGRPMSSRMALWQRK